MYSTKTSSGRFDCWNQESWSTRVDDWNHYRSENHHTYGHLHPSPQSTTLAPPPTSLAPSQPPPLPSHHHHHHHHHMHHVEHYSLHNPDHHHNDLNENVQRHRQFSDQTDSNRISYVYNNNNQTTSSNLNETFVPSRIEYCETYPTGLHQYQQEYSYYEQPEQCNYSSRQWSNHNQFSVSSPSAIQSQSHSSSLAHHHLHRSPSHTHPDLLSYHRYESTGQSVTNVTNNSISVNLALNIPALPVSDSAQQTTVASTIQYKIQTQLEKRITITPQQLKTTQLQANNNNVSSQNKPTTTTTTTAAAATTTNKQESLYSQLKHYRIPKRNSALLRETNQNESEIISSQGQNQNICFICGKNYARPSTLKTHLRTHSGEKPYRCHFCGKAFTQAANLTAHIRTHSGEKPFPCPICKRRFSQSSSVTTHLRIHSGERPYLCNYCRKSFSDSSTLTKHLRIHSGEKPYQCRMCTLRFSQSGNLNRHMRVHV